ncbi:MAG: hypothetical protein PHO53_05480 [Actinomycetota bacterium]|nr:hypothetical protein [Actinomycetota bacterium]
MHWTTHILVGAATGLMMKKPILSVPAGLTEHVIMDVIPHRDFQSRLGYILDTLIGIGIFTELIRFQKNSNASDAKAAVWGGISNALPDVELLLNLFEKLPREKRLFPTHNGTLPHGIEYLGMSSHVPIMLEAAATGISIFILGKRLKNSFERGA